MGRDLHLVVEVRFDLVVKTLGNSIGGSNRTSQVFTGAWQPYTVMPRPIRHRNVFNYLMETPKGLPRDICQVTQLLVDQDPGYHHKSWLDLNELIEFQKQFRTAREGAPCWSYFVPYLFGYKAENMLSEDRRIPSEVTDVRAVYWFDN